MPNLIKFDGSNHAYQTTYQPQRDEIFRAIKLLSITETMAYKVHHIFAQKLIQPTQDNWPIVVSCRSETKQYIIHGLQLCDCPAFEHGNGLRCKHLESLRVYRSILRRHLNLRIDGSSYTLRSERLTNRDRPNTFLMIDHNQAITHMDRRDRIATTVCTFRIRGKRQSQSYDFANCQQMFYFSRWLDKAAPLILDEQATNVTSPLPPEQATNVTSPEEIYADMLSRGATQADAALLADISLTNDFDDYIYMQGTK